MSSGRSSGSIVVPPPIAGGRQPSSSVLQINLIRSVLDRQFKKKLATVLAEEAEQHPGKIVEVFATDEHRVGLKPILRRVWAPKGERPRAPGHHRFEWLYVIAFAADLGRGLLVLGERGVEA